MPESSVKQRVYAVCQRLAMVTMLTGWSLVAEAGVQPNILLIVVDDMGWSDAQPFGGEIRTPTISQLAAEGTLYTQFYVSPTCSPTRSMLLTGMDNHLAGLGSMGETTRPNQHGQPGYEGYLNDRVVSVASLLRDAGYATFLAGKWHLGDNPKHWPDKKGFERSYAMLLGGTSHFGDEAPMYKDYYPIYVEDGKRTHVPDDFYSSTFYVDKMLEFIDTRDENRPFFGYVAFTAPHDPLHVPNDWLDKYKGRYNAGPSALREERMTRLKKMGLVPPDAELWQIPNPPKGSPMHQPTWEELPEAKRAHSARSMEIYAAMIELLDQELGRLLDNLKRRGEYDNTYVVFFSDNGSNGATMEQYPGNTREWLELNSDNRLENLGKKGSRAAIGPLWALSSNSPLRLFKAFVAEGGIRSPLIVKGPGIGPGARSDAVQHVMDMAPTFLEIANTTYPKTYGGREVLPMQGKPLLSLWQGTEHTVRSDNDLLGWELFGWRAARRGNWKLTWLPRPFGSSDWQLYDMRRDPGAANNLASRYPEKVRELIAAYEEYARASGVIPPEPPMTFLTEDTEEMDPRGAP